MTIRTAGLCATTLALLFSWAGTSHAASSGLVINEQIQLGDVFSQQTLNVEEAPEGLGATTTAVGNIIGATGRNARLDFQNAQSVDGHVEAATDAQVGGATGEYFVTDTSATGNSATAGTCCALTLGTSQQWINGDAVVAADAYSRTGDQAASVSVDASAIGNTQGWNQVRGESDVFSEQINSGLTSATNTGDFDSSPGNIGLTSTAVANNVTGTIENAPMDIGAEQSRWGPGVNAVVDAFVGSAVDVQAIATASGNLVDVQAMSPTANLSVAQTGEADVNAYANLNIGQWSGDANAIGNAVSGSSCTECGGDFGGFNRQVNGSRVSSQSNVVITGRAGVVSSDSAAIGNTATYQVYSNGGE